MNKSIVIVLGIALLGMAVLAMPVAGVSSSSEDLPAETEVGEQIETTFELTDLYTDFESWTLHGETELENVTWTVVMLDQAGNQVEQNDYDGQEFEQAVSIDDGTHSVEVRITGEVPEIEEFSYDPAETYTAGQFSLLREGGTQGEIGKHDVHKYTAESKSAREAIDDARNAVEAASDDQAERTLNNAISAYNSGDFENAIDLAEQAKESAERSALIGSAMVYGGAGIVVLVIIAGAVYFYRKRQQGPSRLR